MAAYIPVITVAKPIILFHDIFFIAQGDWDPQQITNSQVSLSIDAVSSGGLARIETGLRSLPEHTVSHAVHTYYHIQLYKYKINLSLNQRLRYLSDNITIKYFFINYRVHAHACRYYSY